MSKLKVICRFLKYFISILSFAYIVNNLSKEFSVKTDYNNNFLFLVCNLCYYFVFYFNYVKDLYVTLYFLTVKR